MQTIGRLSRLSSRKMPRLALLVLLPLWILASNLFTPASGKPSSSMQTSTQQESAESQKPQEATTLEPGKAVTRQISGGQNHIYQISLSEGQQFNVAIKQQGANVGVSLRLPGGATLPWSFDAPIFQQEWEFGHVAESSGVYRLDVSAKAKGPAGYYEIRIAELRVATENDHAYHHSRKLFAEYWRLHRQGKYLEARPLLLRTLEIREKVLGADHYHVALMLGYLAVNYGNTGDYASAEPLRLRELKILETALGPDHPAVASALNGLGSLYLRKGDDFKAEEFDLRALGIFDRARQSEIYEVAALSGALGGIYYARGDYENAEKYYQRSRAVLEKIFGPDHFHLADSFTFLGRVAYDAGDYAKAEAMFKRALALGEKGLGEDHLGLTSYRNDLAMAHSTTGDYATAESLYQRALLVHEQKLAMSHPAAQETLFDMARLYAAQGMLPQAIKFQSRASEIEEGYIDLNLAVGSEREKLAFLGNLSSRSSRNISLHTKLAPNDQGARDLAVTTILRRKGRVQDALSASLAALRQRFSAEDQKILDELSEETSRLAKLVVNGPQKVTAAEHQAQIKTLEAERERLEAEISRRSAGFYERLPAVTLAAVQAAIPSDAALIEFAVYRPFDPKAPDNQKAYGEPHYVAYVICREGEVQWKDLGETKKIDEAIAGFRQALRDAKRKDVQELARSVDEKVMRPLRPMPGGATHLLISPDGELNLIPFEALVNEQGNYLIQHYAVTYLTSGRDLLRMQAAHEGKSKAPVVTHPLVVADPSFDEPVAGQIARVDATKKRSAAGGRRRSVTAARDLSEVYFAPLGGTADEARTIRRLFRESELLTGAQATESAIKTAAAPRVLHVATHGFFLSDRGPVPTGSVAPATRGINANANPLLRSGLALAGANRRGETGDDGILTALEATGLNLWGTKLVVLSACDTGLGEVRNGEGVYGLRRAFVLAGAESLVMSLWPVSDYPTKKLMTEYYTNLQRGLGRGDALRQAQLGMLENKLHPFYWANFIQSGDWASLDGSKR